MIIFKQIRYSNFLSSGNQVTEINLKSKETTLIIGSNGSGKSTLLDALCFVLFNKPFRKITKNQILNSTNEKECLVEIEFDIGNKEYKIIRGIKPNIFEIWINGSLQNQLSSSIDQQKQLEENILKLNYKSFTQIVILGSASFVPFMQLTMSNRREVVEDLLDIKIFSSMNSVVKEKIRDINEKLKEIDLTIRMTKEKIEMQREFIENIQKNGEEDIKIKQQKINENKKEIINLIEDNKLKNDKIKYFQIEIKKLSDTSKKIKELSSLKGKITQKISTLHNESEFFNTNVICPTCTQKIDEEIRLNKINDICNKEKDLQIGYQQLKEAIEKEEEREFNFNTLSKQINGLNNQISNNNVKISQLNKQSDDLEKEIQKIASKNKNEDTEGKVLTDLIQNLSKLKEEKIVYKEKNSYFDFVHYLMKDSGIKTKIIKKYLPLMNQQINKYLQLMDFYINFTLDEEFKEKIKTPIHEDFSYDSFSEGEKMRINLAILFTWREIARLKNSINTNLLILDEVFDSSLDNYGTEYFTKIIKYIIKNTNVFVISHKTDELIDKFDRVIKFEKIKGFSKMVDS